MINVNKNKAATVAAKVQDAFSTYDIAYRSALLLLTSFLDMNEGSKMAARESQKVMQALHHSAGDLLTGRAGMVSAVAVLTNLQKRSNQAETDFGCPGAGPWLAELPAKLAVAA